jgi:methylenetetrahydrofolate reductase (NADPH)
VAGYPEKHFEAPNFRSDLKNLKMKVDAGSDYIVTQMFFDNKKYFEFVQQCRDMGISIPIVPGIKVLTTKKQLTILPKTFNIDIPGDLQDEVEKCQTDKEVKEVGIAWCINQTKELKKSGAPCLHFYTMGTSDAVRRVASEVF